jgi:hypothetical protein
MCPVQHMRKLFDMRGLSHLRGEDRDSGALDVSRQRTFGVEEDREEKMNKHSSLAVDLLPPLPYLQRINTHQVLIVRIVLSPHSHTDVLTQSRHGSQMIQSGLSSAFCCMLDSLLPYVQIPVRERRNVGYAGRSEQKGL